MFKNALIMAAGSGSRMKPITDYIPKALIKYSDSKTLIERHIDTFQQYSIDVHVTVGHKSEMLIPILLKNHVGSIINTSGQDNSWWIYNSLLSNLNEPVLITTCDSVIDIDVQLLYDEYVKFGSPACVVVPVKCIKGIEGDFITKNKNGLITKLSRENKTDIYCSGIQILNPFKINQITNPESNFFNVWSQLIQKKEMYCSDNFPENWYSIDTIEQLNNLKHSIKLLAY